MQIRTKAFARNMANAFFYVQLKNYQWGETAMMLKRGEI